MRWWWALPLLLLASPALPKVTCYPTPCGESQPGFPTFTVCKTIETPISNEDWPSIFSELNTTLQSLSLCDTNTIEKDATPS